MLEDNSPPKSFNSEPDTEGLRVLFRTELRRLKYEAERRLGRGVEMAAVSLPDYWYQDAKFVLLEAIEEVGFNVRPSMLRSEEQMARIAYNLGEKKDRESWFLILVDYHPEYFYLTFAEMTACTDRDSHSVYPIGGRYLLKNLGETSRIRSPADDQHCRNIKDASRVFLLKHTVNDPDNIFNEEGAHLSENIFSDIKAVVLTGDASIKVMGMMRRLLREVFADLRQRQGGTIFKDLEPSHVGALGAAKALWARMVNNSSIRDIYTRVRLN